MTRMVKKKVAKKVSKAKPPAKSPKRAKALVGKAAKPTPGENQTGGPGPSAARVPAFTMPATIGGSGQRGGPQGQTLRALFLSEGRYLWLHRRGVRLSGSSARAWKFRFNGHRRVERQSQKP